MIFEFKFFSSSCVRFLFEGGVYWWRTGHSGHYLAPDRGGGGGGGGGRRILAVLQKMYLIALLCTVVFSWFSPPPPSLAYKFLKPYDPAKSSDRPPSDDKFRQVPNWLLSAAFNWVYIISQYSLSDILTDNTGKKNRRGFFSQYSIFSGQFTNESATTEHLLFLSRPQSGMGSIRDTTWCFWHLDLC